MRKHISDKSESLYLTAPKGYSTCHMNAIKGTSPQRVGLAAVPLAVAYGAIPLGNAAARFSGATGDVSPNLPWLLLVGLGTILAMHRPTPGAHSRKRFLFNAGLFVLTVAALFIYSSGIIAAQTALIPYLFELSPLIFLLFCGLWASTCGLPDRADFQRFGALLGSLCVFDLGSEVILYHAVPTIRWIGNADVLAGLLLVSLCAGLKPGGNEGGIPEPDQGRTLWRVLTLLGVLACLSRTGLFAAAWVVLCFGRSRLRTRLLFSLTCVLFLVGTFFLPATSTDAVRYTDYWLWVEALRLYAENSMTLFTGFPINMPLPVNFPVGMGPIWEAATGSPSTFGAFLPQVPSFWLRLTMGWGIGAPLILLTVMFVLLLNRLTRMGAGLTAALFAQGMTTPLLFDPAMCISIGLAFGVAISLPPRTHNTKVVEPPESEPQQPQNPVDE